MNTSTEVQAKPENPLLNLLFNIILPVMILNQLSKRLGESGPLIALIIAVTIPITYGIYDYITRRKRNYLSILGLLNVLVTGSLALMRLDGMWFSVKEAFFPVLIGASVFFSNMLGRPFLRTLFWNEHLFRVSQIETRLKQNGSDFLLDMLFRRITLLFSISFFMSAGFNFWLALKIFVPLPAGLSDMARSEAINLQIAQMTWKAYVIIALPMMLFMAIILWYMIFQLKRLTGLSLDELMPDDEKKVHSPVSSP